MKQLILTKKKKQDLVLTKKEGTKPKKPWNRYAINTKTLTME